MIKCPNFGNMQFLPLNIFRYHSLFEFAEAWYHKKNASCPPQILTKMLTIFVLEILLRARARARLD